VGWLPLSVSQVVCKIDVEIVGWLPQLDSRILDNNIIRMIDNSNKYFQSSVGQTAPPAALETGRASRPALMCTGAQQEVPGGKSSCPVCARS